jgi:hypothetical protein
VWEKGWSGGMGVVMGRLLLSTVTSKGGGGGMLLHTLSNSLGKSPSLGGGGKDEFVRVEWGGGGNGGGQGGVNLPRPLASLCRSGSSKALESHGMLTRIFSEDSAGSTDMLTVSLLQVDRVMWSSHGWGSRGGLGRGLACWC